MKDLNKEIIEIESSIITKKTELLNLRKDESVSIETLIEKNTEIKNLEKSIIEKKESITRFFNKVTEIRIFCKEKNMNLNDFLKFKSFFKKSKKAAKSNTSNSIGSIEILEGKIINITPSGKKGIFNGVLKSENLNKKVRFYGKKFLYNNENEINISNVLLDKYNFIR